jgi:CheR methyltransferase, all-alpha domain
VGFAQRDMQRLRRLIREHAGIHLNDTKREMV